MVVTLGCFLDDCVAAGHADVVGDAHVAVLPPADLDAGLVLRVDDVEHLLGTRTADGLEYDEVGVGLLDLHDVHDAVVVSNLKRIHLLAQLTV